MKRGTTVEKLQIARSIVTDARLQPLEDADHRAGVAGPRSQLDESFGERWKHMGDRRMDVVVSVMATTQAVATSDLIRRTITPLTYYNDRAKQEELAKYTPSALETLSSEDPDAVMVATIGDLVVGFCISRYDDGLLWLAWFGVDQAHRGVGVGSQLLDSLAHSLTKRRAHKIWCDTRTSNDISAQVLERKGFRRLAELTNHWYGQDFYLWEWCPP